MSFYSDLGKTALGLLKDKGRNVVLKQLSGKTFDPVAGEYFGGDTVETTVKGVKLNFKRGEIDGENIIEGDARLYLPNTVTPQPGDKVTIRAVDWHIVGVDTTEPADESVVHVCQVRK